MIEINGSSGPPPEMARLFFALWPEHKTRAALHRLAEKLQRQCGGRPARPETLHMTLVFLGAVPLSRLPALRVAASSIAVPAFSVALGRTGWWHHNRIAWAGTDTVPPALAVLVGELRERLSAAGFAFDAKAYVPHVTLLRKARCQEQEFPQLALKWPVREFVLVRSVLGEQGAAYELIGRWELQR